MVLPDGDLPGAGCCAAGDGAFLIPKDMRSALPHALTHCKALLSAASVMCAACVAVTGAQQIADRHAFWCRRARGRCRRLRQRLAAGAPTVAHVSAVLFAPQRPGAQCCRVRRGVAFGRGGFAASRIRVVARAEVRRRCCQQQGVAPAVGRAVSCPSCLPSTAQLHIRISCIVTVHR